MRLPLVREIDRRVVLRSTGQSVEDHVSSTFQVAAANLPSIDLPSRNWQRWLSAAVSILLLAVVVTQLSHLNVRQLLSAIPHSPGFWLALAAYYLALPFSEWIIFRRLWKLPAEGFAALLRKLVSNEVLVGYSGELTFYAWARRHSQLTNAPFGAIKDVSITSALAGNIITLTMMGLAWPYVSQLHAGVGAREVALSIGVILLISIGAALFKRKIFSLPGDQLRFVMTTHLCRLIATTLLSGILWHFALPEVVLTTWIVLAALQLLVTRLPFIPNKDLVFANATILMVGSHSAIGNLIAIVAGLILITHLIVGGTLAAIDLAAEANAA